MAAEYQEPDWPVVDYQTYCLDERLLDPSRDQALRVRGLRPERLEPGRYAVFLGAAQTFGRFSADPFPSQLGRRLGSIARLISHGGAGAPQTPAQPGRPAASHIPPARERQT